TRVLPGMARTRARAGAAHPRLHGVGTGAPASPLASHSQSARRRAAALPLEPGGVPPLRGDRAPALGAAPVAVRPGMRAGGARAEGPAAAPGWRAGRRGTLRVLQHRLLDQSQ